MDDLPYLAKLWPSSPLVELAAGVPGWVERARCRDADPDVFFAGKGGQSAEAVRICETCPVTEECLAYALSVPYHDD